jgi:SAM-dependent methyltransferase
MTRPWSVLRSVGDSHPRQEREFVVLEPKSPQALAHDHRQLAYFERTTKKTMVPKDTPYLRRHIEEAMRFARLSPEEKVVEVGCGMGRYTLLLAARGVAVTGLDLSPVLLERLQAFNAGRYPLDVCCGDLEAPPPELSGRFDAVMGFFVLHHVHDVRRALNGVAGLLRPGGRVVFVEPNPFNPLYYFQILITPGMSWQREKGLLRMRLRRLSAAMAAVGLGAFEARTFGFFPPFIANRRWAPRVEATLERIPILRQVLPFYLFGGRRV